MIGQDPFQKMTWSIAYGTNKMGSAQKNIWI
jgi:hypothetical protein